MKLKDGVYVRYDKENKATLINKGTDEFQIDDTKKYYYHIFSKKIYDENTPREITNFLIDNGLVCEEYEHNITEDFFERNLFFFESFSDSYEINPPEIQELLKNTKIGVIGGGGIGTVVIDNLQRIGIKEFTVVDFDVVESSNLNRQVLFRNRDINKSKTQAIASNLLNDVKVNEVNKKIELKEDLNIDHLKNVDFLVNCADTPHDIIQIIASFCTENNIPFISGNVGIDTGSWGPIYDLNNTYKYKIDDDYTAKVKGSISPTNCIIGCFLAYDIMIYLTKLNSNYPYYKEKIIDFKNLKIEVI
jgi:molybdopterin/thiamine biosynthesis adenylyltransferase